MVARMLSHRPCARCKEASTIASSGPVDLTDVRQVFSKRVSKLVFRVAVPPSHREVSSKSVREA